MQIYNLTVNNQKFQIPASCTLEQLHYSLLYVLSQNYSNDYSFSDNSRKWQEPLTRSTIIAGLDNDFYYRLGNQKFPIKIRSANVGEYLYPLSEAANLNDKLRQDFLLPSSCHTSDYKALKIKLLSLLDNFQKDQIIKSGNFHIHYSLDEDAYCIDVYESAQHLQIALNSKSDSIFKKAFSLILIPAEDYFDLSEFDFGTVYEIDKIANLMPLVHAVLALERQPQSRKLDFSNDPIDYFLPMGDIKTTVINPGKLQVVLKLEDDQEPGVSLQLAHGNVVDQQPLEYHDFCQLCAQIEQLVIAKIEQIGLVQKIEVNDNNIYNILLPLSRFNITIVKSDFNLENADFEPFANSKIDRATTEEILSKLVNKYGYMRLSQKVMNSTNLSLSDLMALAAEIKNQDIDLNDPQTKELVAGLYEAFKDDLN